MTCTPYDPAPGDFYNTLGWGTQSQGPWTFGLKQGSTDTYELKKNGVVMSSLYIPNPGAVRWIFFPNTNFLAVRDAATSGGFVDFRIWIFDLRGTTVNQYGLQGGPYSGSGTSPQLHFHPTQDGLAFFIFIADGLPNSSKQHIVFRTDTGSQICGYGPIFNETAQRKARITSSHTVQIGTSPAPNGFNVLAESPLGQCQVQPSTTLNLPEAVVGGPPALAITTKQFTIKNSGKECLQVNSIQNNPPFSAEPSSGTLPACIDPGSSMSFKATFAPTTTGQSDKELTITCTPAAGDSKIRCVANARPPRAKLTISPSTQLPFNKQPVNSSTTKNLTLSNDGEVDLTISASTPDPQTALAFQWANPPTTLGYGGSYDIPITFKPPTKGDFQGQITITNETDNTDHKITLIGSGCEATPEIQVPTAPFPPFGDVQKGFRMVRYIRVKNPGEGTLVFSAHIDGVDKALFGLVNDPPNDSIVDVVNNRSYVVDPISPCGSGPSGEGEVIVAVVFFANDTPRTAQAELIIDNHNGKNNVPASFSFAMSANIIASVNVEAVLVLDRSGSMGEIVGERRKEDATIAGGGLFASLIRPNMSDSLGIVKYDEVIDVLQPIVVVSQSNQAQIISKINPNELSPRGCTCIAGGVMVALDQFVTAQQIPPSNTKAIVVLTDGMDNTGYLNPSDNQWYSILGGNSRHPADRSIISTYEMSPPPQGLKIYGIGIGRTEDIDEAALDKLSTVTGAYHAVAGDLTGDTYFDLEKYFVRIYMDIIEKEFVSDPVYTIRPGESQEFEFDILKSDVSALVVIFDHEGKRIPFRIVSPKGEVIDGIRAPPGFQLRSGSSVTARFVDFILPPKETDRYAGRWKVIVEHKGEVCYGKVGTGIDTQSGFLPYKCTKYQDPISYGIAIGAGSNFRMQPYLTPGRVLIGDPILLSAIITEAELPVTGCTVTVRAVAPSGAMWSFPLFDDGVHQDGEPDDGEYASFFNKTAEAGSYEFTFRAEGVSRDGEPVTREAVRSKYVEGRITTEPNGGRPGEPDLCCERLVRMLGKILTKQQLIEKQLKAMQHIQQKE